MNKTKVLNRIEEMGFPISERIEDDVNYIVKNKEYENIPEMDVFTGSLNVLCIQKEGDQYGLDFEARKRVKYGLMWEIASVQELKEGALE